MKLKIPYFFFLLCISSKKKQRSRLKHHARSTNSCIWKHTIYTNVLTSLFQVLYRLCPRMKKRYSLDSGLTDLCSYTATRINKLQKLKTQWDVQKWLFKNGSTTLPHKEEQTTWQNSLGAGRHDSFCLCSGKAQLQGIMENVTLETTYPCLPQTLPFLLLM